MLTNESLLVRFIHALGDKDSAFLLWYLLAQDGDANCLRLSRRTIHSDLGGAIGLSNVLVATSRLVNAGLISIRVHPRTYTEYSVDANAVIALLKRPLPPANFLPGIAPSHIPFLTRANAHASFDRVETSNAILSRAVDPSNTLFTMEDPS